MKNLRSCAAVLSSVIVCLCACNAQAQAPTPLTTIQAPQGGKIVYGTFSNGTAGWLQQSFPDRIEKVPTSQYIKGTDYYRSSPQGAVSGYQRRARAVWRRESSFGNAFCGGLVQA